MRMPMTECAGRRRGRRVGRGRGGRGGALGALGALAVLCACVCLCLLAWGVQEGEARGRDQAQAGEERDFYKILGVSRDASERDIKKAYRKLSLKYHPDKNPAEDAKDRFADVAAAYEALSDEDKRETYNRGGEKALREKEAMESAGASQQDPFSIFETFGFGGFGGRGHSQDEPRSPNLEIPLRVSLAQLYVGDVLELEYVRQVLCVDHRECQKNCPDCQGPGVRVRTQQLAPGFVQQVQGRDPACVARGKCWRKKCKACPNGMTESEEIQLIVDVQAGMASGDAITFEQVADELVGHLPGDLVLRIEAMPHPLFRRDGHHLHMTLAIPLLDALVGFRTTVEHLDGHEVVIQKDDVTSCGDVLKIPGEGMPVQGREFFGDLFVTFEIKFPSRLSEKNKQLLEQALPFTMNEEDEAA